MSNDQRMVDVELLRSVTEFIEHFGSDDRADKLRGIIDGPGVEPVATVSDAYDCNGLHWHCQHPPADGTPLYLAAPSAPAVPDGWQLVPTKATQAMTEAFYNIHSNCFAEQYAAMLAAAPQPQIEDKEK